ncbi:MAG: sensor histidine kinase [Actinomycetota bacterium]
MTTTTSNRGSTRAFRHEAHLYAGQDAFVEAMTTFIRAGLEAVEPVLVVVVSSKIELLRDALGSDADEVLFADMGEIGRNPARIIPVWQEFVNGRADGGAVRGIGEPIWAGRTPQEIVEAQRHESLINLAFDGAPAWILCPYDTEAFDAAVIDEALRSHPLVGGDGLGAASSVYRGLGAIAQPFDAALPEPRVVEEVFEVAPGQLEALRLLVSGLAADFGLDRNRTRDLVLAINEVATNTLRHSGGRGTFRTWRDGETLVAEISDHGHIDQPLVGRVAPAPEQETGLGLWIVNQLCDLVQVRSYPGGSIVRIHMARR